MPDATSEIESETWEPMEDPAPVPVAAVTVSPVVHEPEVLPPALSDDGLALEFTRQHAENLRYTAKWGSWLEWGGSKWVREETLNVFDLVRKTCRYVDERNPKEDGKKRGVKGATIASVERVARADRRHFATVDQWDKNAWLLNTPSGIVDLRTGKMEQPRREEYMTKSTTATLSGADYPIWNQFLQDVTGGDDELAEYLARVAGYTLTGSVRDNAMFCLHGSGGNGKSIFLSTLAHVMGDYATGAPMDMFLETKGDKHPTDMAGLQGARLVSSGEIEKGRRWAEAKLKALTGGDPVTARFMRGDFFSYDPNFKIILAFNDKPAISDVGEAIRRRMHLIPFGVTIPKEKRDPDLKAKLMAERDGILQWAVNGCLAWQRDGLRPPASVTSATDDYLASEDSMGRWMEENSKIDKSARTMNATLFADWKTWAELNGEYVGNVRKLSNEMDKRGFKRFVSNSKRGFVGIGLKGDAVQEDFTAGPEAPEYQEDDAREPD